MIPTDLAHLTSIRTRTLEVLRSHLDGAKEVALLDYPWHQNVGDSMIWAGELSYLRTLGVALRYSADIAHFDPTILRKRLPLGPILLHGGGNFGDVWPHFQHFRLRIAKAFPDRKIIQLPQSVQFSSAAGAAETDATLSEHPDFTLLVRDNASLEKAQKLLPNVRIAYCHDMALGWAPDKISTRQNERDSGVAILERRDREATGLIQEALATLDAPPPPFDWGLSRTDLLLWRAAKFPGKAWRAGSSAKVRGVLDHAMVAGRRRMLSLNLHAGTRSVAPATALVTDRLHAHVLAALLGVPHLVVDNSYGKIGPIYADYTGKFTTASFATTSEEVREFIATHQAVNIE